MTKRIVKLSVVCAFMLAVLVAAPASAQTGYGETINVHAGDVVRLSGTCHGDEVQITLDGIVIATTVPAEDGSWSVDITVPADATVGPHTGQVLCDGRVNLVFTLNVLAGGEGGLPRTGNSDTGLLVGIGLAALLLGASFLVGRRRVERTTTSS